MTKIIDKPLECTLKFNNTVIEKKSRKILNKLIFFIEKKSENNIHVVVCKTRNKTHLRNFHTCHNIESIIIEIIKTLTNQNEVSELIEFFEKQQLAFGDNQRNIQIIKNVQKGKKLKYTSVTKIGFIILNLILIIIIYMWYDKSNTYIRSELILPHKKYILPRSNIIAEIKERFEKNKSSIKCLNITGIGGAGKTTLSRLYAKAHKGLVWEFNAETQESLKEALKNFAIALVDNKKDKEQWVFINSLKKEHEKERALLTFIHKKLRLSPGWLLIFDNVNDFKKIKKYIPQDAILSGKGYILITTRNANNFFGDNFKIPDLSEEEVFSLFTKYFSRQPVEKSKEECDLNFFLKKIPHYPLDVTIASHI